MDNITHLVVSYFLGKYLMSIGWIFQKIEFWIVVLWGGFLIDIDHLFYFFGKYGKLGLKKLVKKWWEYGKNMRPGFYIFHSPEFTLLLMFLSFFNKIIFVMFLSQILHLILDIIPHYIVHGNFIFIKKWSIIHNLT